MTMKTTEAMVQKSESLADKMNKLTQKLSQNLDTASDLEVTGDDIIEYVEEKTKDITLSSDKSELNNEVSKQIVNLDNMISDFKYVRDTLKENIDNGRRVLNSVTLDLLEADEESRASLVIAFAQLNSAIATNSKIYLASYKQISDVILNLDKIQKQEKDAFKKDSEQKGDTYVTENHLHINGDPVSTVDLIKQLSSKS